MIRIPTDKYGNRGAVVEARKHHRCEADNHGCKKWIEPKEFYLRLVAFPDGDVNTSEAPWVMRICKNCLNPELLKSFEEALNARV